MSRSKALSLDQARIDRLRQSFIAHQALLLSNPTDITYFTGFRSLVPEEREAFLIITPNSAHLLHASFSPFEPTPNLVVSKSCSLEKLDQKLAELIKAEGIKECLIDEDNLVVGEYQALQQIKQLKINPLQRQHIWQLRTIKDRQEISLLTQAAKLTAQIMTQVLAELKAGMTEQELKNQIESQLKQAGSEKPAFPTIVAFGSHSALPHHQPTNTRLKPETVVLLDFGAMSGGYRGDMTRTVWFGNKPTQKFLAVKKIVHQAYDKTLEKLKTSIKADDKLLAQDLDQAARGVIAEAKYGTHFIHTTGHGLGLDIHETLSLSWKNQQPIMPGMVLTLEPGIYLEGEFGYRYENMVLVKKDGAQELTAGWSLTKCGPTENRTRDLPVREVRYATYLWALKAY